MSEIDEMIDALGEMKTEVADALRQVVGHAGVLADRQAGYISVRPHDRHIAAYFNREFVDIAVPPQLGKVLAETHAGTEARVKTPATTYFRVPWNKVHAVPIDELVADALSWRESGTHWEGEYGPTGVAPATAGAATCEHCFQQKTPTGACGCD